MNILCLHIDGHGRLYPYLAICEASESCEFNSWLKDDLNKRSANFSAKRCRILHSSIIRKRRHKDHSCVRAPSVGLVIIHCATSLLSPMSPLFGRWRPRCTDVARRWRLRWYPFQRRPQRRRRQRVDPTRPTRW